MLKIKVSGPFEQWFCKIRFCRKVQYPLVNGVNYFTGARYQHQQNHHHALLYFHVFKFKSVL